MGERAHDGTCVNTLSRIGFYRHKFGYPYKEHLGISHESLTLFQLAICCAYAFEPAGGCRF